MSSVRPYNSSVNVGATVNSRPAHVELGLITSERSPGNASRRHPADIIRNVALGSSQANHANSQSLGRYMLLNTSREVLLNQYSIGRME
jgi:hypothetical protein